MRMVMDVVVSAMEKEQERRRSVKVRKRRWLDECREVDFDLKLHYVKPPTDYLNNLLTKLFTYRLKNSHRRYME